MYNNVNKIAMKTYKSKFIQQSEIVQLFILDEIYSLPVSKKLLFQGGTCLRWMYGGTRYSEDLDFLGHRIKPQEVRDLLSSLEKKLKKKVVVQFGPGEFELIEKKSSQFLNTFHVKYRRDNERTKAIIKVEIQQAEWNDANRQVLRQVPEVNRFLQEVNILVPFGKSIIVCAPAMEILAEKIKSLLERSYLKGRDFYDIWLLTQTLRLKVSPDLVIERTKAYPGDFSSKRSLLDFLKNSTRDEVKESLSELRRFLPAGEYSLHHEQDYRDILDAVEEAVRELLEEGLHETII